MRASGGDVRCATVLDSHSIWRSRQTMHRYVFCCFLLFIEEIDLCFSHSVVHTHNTSTQTLFGYAWRLVLVDSPSLWAVLCLAFASAVLAFFAAVLSVCRD